MGDVVSIEDFRPTFPLSVVGVGFAKAVVFNKPDLDLILQTYGRKVIAGEWRDYMLEFAPHHASFSFIRKFGRVPEYHVIKRRKGQSAGGRFSVISPEGFVLKRGPFLAEVLTIFDYC